MKKVTNKPTKLTEALASLQAKGRGIVFNEVRSNIVNGFYVVVCDMRDRTPLYCSPVSSVCRGNSPTKDVYDWVLNNYKKLAAR